jgi:hypothetical protein
MENRMEIPQKTRDRTAIRSSDTPLGIYSKEHKTGYSRDTCTPMFNAALFTISELWKHPRCLTTDEWIKKIWFIYTVQYYSTIKKNEIMLFASKWKQF